MGKIAIFGGSFDPVHNAHIQMAHLSLQIKDLKKIIFTPAFSPPHKNKVLTPHIHRIEMLKTASADLEKTEINLYEIEKSGVVYSYQTLDYFQSIYHSDEIFMLIGSDSLKSLKTWAKIDYIASKYNFIVVKRGNDEIGQDLEFLSRCLIVKEAADGISSTQIRNLILSGKDASPFLNKDVYKYIKENKLYGYGKNL